MFDARLGIGCLGAQLKTKVDSSNKNGWLFYWINETSSNCPLIKLGLKTIKDWWEDFQWNNDKAFKKYKLVDGHM
jgi:hypothetical protein